MRKKIAIIAVVVVVLALAIAAPIVYVATPHEMDINELWYRSENDGTYEYLAYADPINCFIDSDTDLSDLIDDNDADSIDSFGEQTLRVEFTGFRTYHTDNSGIFTSYPIPVYEYAGDK